MFKDFFMGIRAFWAYVLFAPADVKSRSCQGCKTWEFNQGHIEFK